jgi:two-component system response regulator HydG
LKQQIRRQQSKRSQQLLPNHRPYRKHCNIEVIAPPLATVLIQGQTGVGKELIARVIHAMSDRCNKPVIPINYGAIPKA